MRRGKRHLPIAACRVPRGSWHDTPRSMDQDSKDCEPGKRLCQDVLSGLGPLHITRTCSRDGTAAWEEACEEKIS